MNPCVRSSSRATASTRVSSSNVSITARARHADQGLELGAAVDALADEQGVGEEVGRPFVQLVEVEVHR